MIFWLLLAFDVVLAAVLLFFFAIGIGDGSISSFNIGLWLLLIAVAAAILGGGLWLKRAGRELPCIMLLLVPAIPGACFLLFVLMLVATQPDWR